MASTPMKSLDEQIEEMRKLEQIERKRARIAQLLKASGVPARFANATFEELEMRNDSLARALSTVRDMTEHFEDYAATGRSIVMLGPTGLAKTHIACAAIRTLCMNGRPARYVTFANMVRRIRNSWRRDIDETELDVLDDLRSPDLLVIDEVGVQHGTDSEQNHTFDVIDARYQDMRPTMVISNSTVEGLLGYMGPRVIDRLLENDGRMLELKGDSYRTAGSRRHNGH